MGIGSSVVPNNTRRNSLGEVDTALSLEALALSRLDWNFQQWVVGEDSTLAHISFEEYFEVGVS